MYMWRTLYVFPTNPSNGINYSHSSYFILEKHINVTFSIINMQLQNMTGTLAL